MEILNDELRLSTQGYNDIIDITGDVATALSRSELKDGHVLVFVPGSTAGLTTIEHESGLIQDLKEFFEKLAGINAHYHHNDRWHDGNGYAHVRAALLKPSLTIPFVDGRLLLGTWQQIVLIDFDNRPRERRLVLQFTGVANH